MKKILLPIFCVIYALTMNAQSFDWREFTKNTAARDGVTSTAYDNEGNRYITGWFVGSLVWQSDTLVNTDNPVDDYYLAQPNAFVAKFDTNGDLVWSHQISGADWQINCDIAVNPATQECYISGMFGAEMVIGNDTIANLPGNYGPRPFIVKYGAEGGMNWYRYFNSTLFSEGGYSIDLNDDGDEIYMLTEYIGDLFSNGDLIHTALGGEITAMGLSTGTGDILHSYVFSSYLTNIQLIECTHNNEVYIAGEAGWEGVVHKLDGTLSNIEYSINIGSPSVLDGVKAISVDNNDNLYVLAYLPDTTQIYTLPDTLNTIIPVAGIKNFAVIKFNDNGDWKYTKTFTADDYRVDFHANDFEIAFVADKSGNVYVGGAYGGSLNIQSETITQSFHYHFYEYDTFIFKLNKRGNLRWISQFEQNEGGELLGLSTYENNILIGGMAAGQFVYDGDTSIVENVTGYVIEMSDCDYTAKITTTGTLVSPGVPQTLSTAFVPYYNYQWQRNGVNLVGATGNTFATDVQGNYRCLISANGCSKLSNKIKLNNSPRLGNTDDQTLLVYPNPTSGAINVSIPGNESDAVTITITNIAGEIIWVKQNVEQLTNVVLPETIASGTYLITVQNSSGTAHSTLVIN